MKLLHIKDAATEYRISETEIKRLLEDGSLTPYQLSNAKGPVDLVAQDEIAAIAADRLINRDQFKHLEGKPISISEASWKYGFHTGTISKWVKEGQIKNLGIDPKHRQRHLINEADIAYAAALRDMKGIRPGRRLW